MGIEFTFVDPSISSEKLNSLFRPNRNKSSANRCQHLPSSFWTSKNLQSGPRPQRPAIVDNTFPTPIHFRPLEWGADIVIHSTTKYMDGHATSVGGAIVDGGLFDWTASREVSGADGPDETYHGIVFTESFGNAAYVSKITTTLMRDLGSIPSPHNAFVKHRIGNTALAHERHSENACSSLVPSKTLASPGSASAVYKRPSVRTGSKYMPKVPAA